MSKINFQWLAALAVAIITPSALATVYFPLATDPTVPLPSQTLQVIQEDWNSSEVQPLEKPDRSFRNIWVRLFPLLSLPLGDPYEETQNVNELFIENSAGLKLYGLDDGALLTTGTVLQFDFKSGRVKVNGKAFVLEPLWIVPASEITLAQWDKDQKLPDGKTNAEIRVRVRGGFVIQQTRHVPRDERPEAMLWSCINVVSVNDYLKSVVPSEVIASWKAETLKAQAIAARTYGLFEVAAARKRGLAYDVDPSTWYQSYQGARFWDRTTRVWRDVELRATNAAVTATANKVIQYKGNLIRAFFSSNSGGRTCTAAECLESGNNLPYLQEVEDAAGIRSAPGGTWGSRANITAATIRDKLKSTGLTLPAAVSKLEHLERGVSGRTWRLRVKLQTGATVDLTREQTRKIMHLFGPIRSFHYELGSVKSTGRQTIVGHGYGHAVGMSQWGAQLFARKGWNAERILKHFYTGVTVAAL